MWSAVEEFCIFHVTPFYFLSFRQSYYYGYSERQRITVTPSFYRESYKVVIEPVVTSHQSYFQTPFYKKYRNDFSKNRYADASKVFNRSTFLDGTLSGLSTYERLDRLSPLRKTKEMGRFISFPRRPRLFLSSAGALRTLKIIICHRYWETHKILSPLVLDITYLF